MQGSIGGGNSGELVFIPHKTNRIIQDTATSGAAVPTGMGLFGGNPACTNEYVMVFGSNVREQLAESSIPCNWQELQGRVERLSPKRANIVQESSDVYVIHWAAGAGYGDPILREIALVQKDLVAGSISHGTAEKIYGVVWDYERDLVNVDATERRRQKLRQSRISTFNANSTQERVQESSREFGKRLSGALWYNKRGNSSQWQCGQCGAFLGEGRHNYKVGAHMNRYPVTEGNRLIGDPAAFVDVSIWWNEYCCPHCGVRLDTELVREGDAALWDIEIKLGE